MFRPLWIEIDLKALRHNFGAIKKYVGSNTKIIATVKQSAYGHGLIPIARELSCLGVDYFGVGSIDEALNLRYSGFVEPILILTALPKAHTDIILKNRITPTIVDYTFAVKLNNEAKRLKAVSPVHIKVDTGMGRLGLYYKDAYQMIKEVSRLKNLSLEGIYTHFPVADCDREFTNYQIGIFNRLIRRLKNEKLSFRYQHCANSLGIMHYPHAHFNMVRPGLILYGIRPSLNTTVPLKPILVLKSKVIFMKNISKGMGVSYGRTFIAKNPTAIATVAVGYADGYPWALSNCAKVIIKKHLFPLAGRVCMDHIMVDVGRNSTVKVGDSVILIGRDGGVSISAEEVASWAKTIPYEITSRLSPRIPRVYKYALD